MNIARATQVLVITRTVNMISIHTADVKKREKYCHLPLQGYIDGWKWRAVSGAECGGEARSKRRKTRRMKKRRKTREQCVERERDRQREM